jgi:hypothetical protein
MISAARPKSTRVAKAHNSPAVAKSRMLVIRILRMVITLGYRLGREKNVSEVQLTKLHSLLESEGLFAGAEQRLLLVFTEFNRHFSNPALRPDCLPFERPWQRSSNSDGMIDRQSCPSSAQ